MIFILMIGMIFHESVLKFRGKSGSFVLCFMNDVVFLYIEVGLRLSLVYTK